MANVFLDRWLVPALIFLAVSAAVMGIYLVLNRGAALRSRLQAVGSVASPVATDADAPSVDWTRLLAIFRPVASLSSPESDEEIGRLRARFMRAGFRHVSAPVVFFAAKTLLALILPGLAFALARLGGVVITGWQGMSLLLCLAAFGYYLPNGLLAAITRRRQRELLNAFPDGIDLIIVCVEAGLGLDMAINRAAREIRLRSPSLADELDLVALELRVGASRELALRHLAVRTGLDEVSAFVTMLLQADRFGTSLAQSLRIHADAMRNQRRLQAEESAAKVPLKLLFPLIFCVFPSLLLVLMGPAMIRIYRVMLPTIAGNP